MLVAYGKPTARPTGCWLGVYYREAQHYYIQCDIISYDARNAGELTPLLPPPAVVLPVRWAVINLIYIDLGPSPRFYMLYIYVRRHVLFQSATPYRQARFIFFRHTMSCISHITPHTYMCIHNK